MPRYTDNIIVNYYFLNAFGTGLNSLFYGDKGPGKINHSDGIGINRHGTVMFFMKKKHGTKTFFSTKYPWDEHFYKMSYSKFNFFIKQTIFSNFI